MELNSSATEFATIDELLDGDEEEEEEEEGDKIPVPEPAVKQEDIVASIELAKDSVLERADDNKVMDNKPEICDDSKVDVKPCPEPEVMVEDTLVDEIIEEDVKQVVSYPPLDAAKMNIFASSLLDDVIKQKELQGAPLVQPNSAMEGELNTYL
jgi:hypothetical protein